MVTKKKTKEKKAKKAKKDENSGMSLDDAFADDEDVEYGESKPRKQKKKRNEDLEEEVEDAEEDVAELEKIENEGEEITNEATIKASKPISAIKKGDKIKIDDKEYEVDAHYVMIDHKKTKEMAIELFDLKTDKDFQLRYFTDQVETSLEFYELQEILYVKKRINQIEW